MIQYATQYQFGGKTLLTNVDEKTLHRLSGLAIEYQVLVRSGGKKAINEARAFFSGFVEHMILSNIVTEDEGEDLITFFLD